MHSLDSGAGPSTAAHHVPQHLNSTGCEIKYVEGKGRAVFASRPLPAQTLLEISPVLLFSSAEYEGHGKYTVLDHYTFKWRDGRMALALGLGSLFNHSNAPNVSYIIEPATESIRYITSRAVEQGEELCIFYGHKLWFDAIDAAEPDPSTAGDEPDDGWGGLTSVDANLDGESDHSDGEYADGDPDEIVPEDELPFVRVRTTPDEVEEESAESIRTVEAWAIDIPDPRHTTTMLKWLKHSGFDTPALAHLKRIRKTRTASALLITTGPTAPAPPAVLDLPLSAPYPVRVPRTAALTKTSLELKNALWPTVFAPRRKHEPEPWARGKLLWAQRAVDTVVREAQRVRDTGELPVVSYVPAPYDDPAQTAFIAHDTRTSAQHALRHSVLNVIRRVADDRASPRTSGSGSAPLPLEAASPPRNGQNYLLTGHTLFTTHEPCIMCAMALLHSRVREVVYVRAMDGTGGCGGAACVPRLEGVNHRFSVLRWTGRVRGGAVLDISADVDA